MSIVRSKLPLSHLLQKREQLYKLEYIRSCSLLSMVHVVWKLGRVYRRSIPYKYVRKLQRNLPWTHFAATTDKDLSSALVGLTMLGRTLLIVAAVMVLHGELKRLWNPLLAYIALIAAYSVYERQSATSYRLNGYEFTSMNLLVGYRPLIPQGFRKT